jgi:hypothetical protein
MNGVAAANLGPALNAGNNRTPRFAATGDTVVTIATSGTDLTWPCFPVNKLQFQKEDSDTSLDTIASGEYLIYFEGGEYETDRYGTMATAAVFGDPLYLDANGYLTTVTGVAGTAATGPRATFIARKTTYDSNYGVTGMLWFRVRGYSA